MLTATTVLLLNGTSGFVMAFNSVSFKILVSAKLLANVRKPPDKFWRTFAEQTVTPALVKYFEGVKNICSSLLLFNQCMR